MLYDCELYSVTRYWRRRTDYELTQSAKETVLPRVKQAFESELELDCPYDCLCHNVDEKRVATLVSQFSDDRPNWTYAVYVVECRPRRVPQRVAREQLRLQNPSQWVEKAQKHNRLVYVGVSQNVVNRLMQHAAGRGGGANFIQLFPVSRLLSIQWFSSRSAAYRAEELTAEMLDDELRGNIYVAQPG